MSSNKTNAARLLDARGIAYDLLPYDLPSEHFNAVAVAIQIDLPASQVFKTLVTTGSTGGPCFAVIPADRELDVKALAAVRSERSMRLLPLREVEGHTGYVRGAVTVIGAKRAYPAVVDGSALDFDVIAVSAGARGLQMSLATQDYLDVTSAIVAGITR